MAVVSPFLSTEDCFVMVTGMCKTMRYACFQLSHLEHGAIALSYADRMSEEELEEAKRVRFNHEEQWNTIFAWMPRMVERFQFLPPDFDETFARTFIDETLRYGCTYPIEGGKSRCLGGCGRWFEMGRFVKRKYCHYNICLECFNRRFGSRKGFFGRYEASFNCGLMSINELLSVYMQLQPTLSRKQFDMLFQHYPPDEWIGNEQDYNHEAFFTTMIGAETNCFAGQPDTTLLKIDNEVDDFLGMFLFYPISYIRSQVEITTRLRMERVNVYLLEEKENKKREREEEEGVSQHYFDQFMERHLERKQRIILFH